MQCPKCKSSLAPGETICHACGFVQTFTPSRPLPTTETEGSCRVCGNPLGGKQSCEMCGAPAVAPPPKAEALRCPFCGGDMGDSISCPKCGGMARGGDEGPEPGFQCPSCGKEMSVEDESCGVCGLRIWLDQVTETAKLEGFSCPVCGAGIGDEDDSCGSCGFQVWLESVEERRDRATRTIEEAKMRIAELQDKFGTVPERAVTYVEAAERVLKEEEADLATRRALVAAEIAQTESRQRGILAEALRRAQERTKSAESRGSDVRKCFELLDLSRQAEGKGDLKVAIRFALKCKIIAEGLEGSRSRVPMGT